MIPVHHLLIRPTVLALLLVVFSIENAWAAFGTECKSLPFLGKIKTVAATTTRVNRQTGIQSGIPTKESDITIDAQQKSMIEVRYQSDTMAALRSRLFPTTTSLFDEKGRLLRQSLTLEGQKDFTVTSCSYDSNGRLTQSLMQSVNPEMNQSVTFEYGPGVIRQRFKTARASILLTQSLDSKGRVIREIETDELLQERRGARDFSYTDNSQTMCTTAEGYIPVCRTTVTDNHGNEIEARSTGSARLTKYEYDAVGNWIVRRTDGFPLSLTEDIITRRQITYW